VACNSAMTLTRSAPSQKSRCLKANGGSGSQMGDALW
jgi:hypothetical protein